MKKIVSMLILFALSFNLMAVSVTFTKGAIHYDGTPIHIQATFGQFSDYHNVRLENRTPYTVTAKVRAKAKPNFVWFEENRQSSTNTLDICIAPFGSSEIKLFAYLKTGDNRTYRDDLEFEILYFNSRRLIGKGSIKMPLTAFLTGPGRALSGSISSKPSEYDAWMPDNRNMVRVNIQDLPLKVYSNHRNYQNASTYSEVVNKAISVYNEAADLVGIENNFFVLTNSRNDADLIVDWSGTGLRSNELGVTRLSTYDGHSYFIEGIVMRQARSGNYGEATETLAQELGHILGMGHSEVGRDIMSHHSDGAWLQISEVKLSQRDLQMLAWLYRQNNYLPILSKKYL